MRRLLLPLLLAFCVPDGALTDALVGRWTMATVVQDGRDVTAEHNPAGDRYVVFHADGTFETGGTPYGRNTGRWTFDEGTQELYLDSDAGEGDDSYWTVTFDGDAMRWQGARSEFTERFVVTHMRAV